MEAKPGQSVIVSWWYPGDEADWLTRRTKGSAPMAEEVVSKEQFGEFVKRFEMGFAAMREDMRDMRADIRQVRNWVVSIFCLGVFGFVGAIALRMFFSN